jgi:hypothetical protein
LSLCLVSERNFFTSMEPCLHGVLNEVYKQAVYYCSLASAWCMSLNNRRSLVAGSCRV